MNKIKMGNFLKNLRLSKNMTANDLIKELDKSFLTVTPKAISDWEHGRTIPELEKLIFLAQFYGVSIDEILEGERFITNESLDDKYHIFKADFDTLLYTKNKDDLKKWFEIRRKGVALLNQNFKKLLIKSFEDELTHNEEIEFGYIFNKQCSLSDYFKSVYTKNTPDQFHDFLHAIKDLKHNSQIKSTKEYYWEIQKYFDYTGNFLQKVRFYDLCNEEAFLHSTFANDLLKQSEPWELDMLVAGFQNFEPIGFAPDKSSALLKDYEKKHGKKFDREAIYKSKLKYVLQHGGMINSYFLSIKEVKKKKHKVIDRLEDLYKLCLRPIEVYMCDDERIGFTKRFFIKNTPFNRFLNSYYSFLFEITNDRNQPITPDLVYDLVVNDSSNEKYIELHCKMNNVDTNRDREYVLADISLYLDSWKNKKKNYFDNEEKIKKGLVEIKKLEQLLEKDETYYFEEYIDEIGPKNIDQLSTYIKFWKSNLSLEDFNSYRERELTNELLNEIDSLSIEQIRNKYFKKEIVEGGNDDE